MIFLYKRALLLICSGLLFLSNYSQKLDTTNTSLREDPLPPDTVIAEILGPDSAVYITWEMPAGRDIVEYEVYRLSNFDPEGDPLSGTQTWYLTTSWPACTDPSWSNLPWGWYAYAVRVLYTGGVYSEMTASNIIGHDLECDVTVNVSLLNGQSVDSMDAYLEKLDWPYGWYQSSGDSSTTVAGVTKGMYYVSGYKTGYDSGTVSPVIIGSDTSFYFELLEKRHQVYDFTVDSVSLWATWSEPVVTLLWEDFEGEQFPPPGWDASTRGRGWLRSGTYPAVPPHDGYYALVIDEGKKTLMSYDAASDNNGCCDYLITPALDLRESEDFVLLFDAYYTGAYGLLAYVEYSDDEGETWELFYQLIPSQFWSTLNLSLNYLGGSDAPPRILFAFHSDDAGGWTTEWAVDNVKILIPSPPTDYLDYNIFLDDSLLLTMEDNSYNYAPLEYGTYHQAAISVNYDHGISTQDTFGFTCRYLTPPSNLIAESDSNEVLLIWDPPVESRDGRVRDSLNIPENLLGYNIYRNLDTLAYQPHTGQYQPQSYLDTNLATGIYEYYVKAVYDLGIYGFPGDTGESVQTPSVILEDLCAAPKELTAILMPDNISIYVYWSLSTITRTPIYYEVFRRGQGQAFSLLGITDSLHFIDESIVLNDMYCYTVNAVYTNGNDTCFGEYGGEVCLVISVGMEETSSAFEIEIYPNPTRDKLMLISGLPMLEIVLRDLSGKTVLIQRPDMYKTTLDCSSVRPGIYLIQIKTNEWQTVKKIVIQ